MELLTHALLGAATTLALRRAIRLPPRHAIALGVAGATFPDADFIGFLVSPLRFLADWHQAATHSLLLLPVWSLAAGALYAWWAGGWRHRLAGAMLVFSAGLASHVALDVLTAYGTMLLFPVSSRRYSLDLLYVVDPYFTMLVALALLALRWGRMPAVLASLSLVAAYVGVLVGAQARALEIARSAAPGEPGRVAVFPQPFSPFNWKLIATQGNAYVVAHLNLLGHRPTVPAFTGRLHGAAAAFEPPDAMQWRAHALLPPASSRQADVAARLWRDPRFEPFRRFATHPALDTASSPDDCIWFTDLRYDLPALPPIFRYGFCRTGSDGSWQLHRLRYLSESSRQRL